VSCPPKSALPFPVGGFQEQIKSLKNQTFISKNSWQGQPFFGFSFAWIAV